MSCYSPLKGWKSRYKNPSGKRSVVFNRNDAFIDMPMEVPCGQCIGCRLERSRQWAIRCVHEAQMFDERGLPSCFITLTYAPEFLPSDGSLVKAHFQKFMKRLRKKFQGAAIRYFHCGEYGALLSRPHYHACLFGFDFKDKVLFRVEDGFRLFRSPDLEELWPFGFSTIGDVTFESAAYVARYVLKKITGEDAKEHYQGRLPEYITMSRGGKGGHGIGYDWLQKYKTDVYPDDFIVIRGGLKCKPPRYYDRIFDIESPEAYIHIRRKRLHDSKVSPDNTPERLQVREKCIERQLKRKNRGFENGNV